MIKKLSQRSTTISSSRLLPVYGIQRLVDEKATRTGYICPQRCLCNNTRKARLLRHTRDYGWLICFIFIFQRGTTGSALGEKIQVRHHEKHSETIRTVKELNSLISTGAQAETG